MVEINRIEIFDDAANYPFMNDGSTKKPRTASGA